MTSTQQATVVRWLDRVQFFVFTGFMFWQLHTKHITSLVYFVAMLGFVSGSMFGYARRAFEVNSKG
jgi:hypothetical protein